MALTKLETVLNKISTLSTVIRGQATTVKAAFDHDANVLKDYINDTLTAEIDTLDSANVKKTGIQTIDGVKTFGSSPIIPTPTTNMQASTKKYVDDMGLNKTIDLDNHKISSDHDSRYYTEVELNSKTDNSSGADKIGITSIPTLAGNTVQEVLESAKNRFDDIAITNVNVEVANSHNAANGQTYISLSKRFDSIDEEFEEVDSQLASTANKTKKSVIDLTKVRSIVTFISDDADLADSRLENISREKVIPFVTAVYPGCPNRLNLKRLQDELGWEIAGHHQNSLATYPQTESAIRGAFEDTINFAKDLGIEIKNHVYANGYHNDLIRRIASEYFDCACQVGGGGGTGNYNISPLTQYSLYRVAMGSYYGAGEGTDIYYKSKVDQAVANNGWLIFMLHPSSSSEYDIQDQYTRNTIDYIKSLGIEIVTLEQGIKIFGNRKIIGDYFDVNNADNYYVIGADGTVKSKAKGILQVDDTILDPVNAHSNASLPADFFSGKITYTPIDNTNVNGFPDSQPGTLETYKLSALDDKYTYQKYRKFNSEGYYFRGWKNGAWTGWIQESYRLPVVTYNVPSQTIAANSSVSISIAVSGNIVYADSVIANPYVSLENGLVWNAILESPTVVKLRIVNTTAASITTAAKDWRIIIIKNAN